MVRIGNPGGNQYGGPPPPRQQPYGHPGMYPPPHYGAPMPPEPPRRSKLKPILGWVGVIIGGVVATVAGSYIVDAVNKKNDDGPDKAPQAVSEKGVAFPEGYTPPPAKAFVDGPRFRATGDKSTWPDACTMLTDAEIQNAIPDAKIIGSREGKPVSGRKDSCTVNLQLPNLQQPSDPAKVTVSIKAIGDAEPVKAAYEKAKAEATSHPNFEDLANKLLVDNAYRDNSTLFLLKPGYFVSVEVLGDIKDSAGGPLGRDAWTKQVGPALVQILNIRMTAE
ncbi:hypothetical protein [Streptomyces sp. SID3343]|uniref:hypothetical protein n=1 Tax=Streptomyces sp. SID3343 TaxID=2690260 RepID=UPI00136BB3D5|nr:hypothetical protein [Streptomyces sp. SID3343]MYW01492.1 hypothetical protein [Streptomyces sp. SID3343]